jgi:hypothetical protein
MLDLYHRCTGPRRRIHFPTMHRRKVIKGQPISLQIHQYNPTKPLTTAAFKLHYYTLNNALPKIHCLLRRCHRFGHWRLRHLHRCTRCRPYVPLGPQPLLLRLRARLYRPVDRHPKQAHWRSPQFGPEQAVRAELRCPPGAGMVLFLPPHFISRDIANAPYY